MRAAARHQSTVRLRGTVGRVDRVERRAKAPTARPGAWIVARKVDSSRNLEDWLAELVAEPANGAIVREMIEASLETDAAGINARRHGDEILFDQRLVYLRAVKPEASD